MVWDFAEVNPFAGAGGDFLGVVNGIAGVLATLPMGEGHLRQCDARKTEDLKGIIISTDPPYYDNISYADLSDYFYVWLRRNLQEIFPKEFSTVLVPKEAELVASSYRHGGVEKAHDFFMTGMTGALKNLLEKAHVAFPTTIYYAFKQSEETEEGVASSGWAAFLQAMCDAGMEIVGTWPMHTEGKTRLIARGTNALASSIVIVCHRRGTDATTVSRKQFLKELEDELPEALGAMMGGEQAAPIAPVDLAQASVGPGMAVFSRHVAVLEADGMAMKVQDALVLINKALDEYFTKTESDLDNDTRFCVDWFQQYGFETAAFGGADVLARAKGTSVEGLVDAGVAEAKGGKVRLLKIDEYRADWDPAKDNRLAIWEACHQLVRALQSSESEAGQLLAKMPEKAEPVRQLGYRLYTVCERKGWTDEAGNYNALVTSWQAIADSAQKAGHVGTQESLL